WAIPLLAAKEEPRKLPLLRRSGPAPRGDTPLDPRVGRSKKSPPLLSQTDESKDGLFFFFLVFEMVLTPERP
ncbi:MAG: hypothetical protein U0L91_01095, partial [Gemmiger sp.]|uniref:hypothetical protein n=1 Tax=Gemmiger sp. TaxID=2049027 RepID=UPI002E77A3B6